MDKQEYKLLSEEIMMLIADEQFQEAAELADRIDWRKVRSFSMLMKISELYQLNRRLEDALELMLMAYDRNPNNRNVVYGLCELYIELQDHVHALEFFSLYRQMAPNDSGLFILQYKIQELEGAAPEDQIELLEEFNRKDYREEWAYQLAYLYHRIGLGTKCVETCNDLITWFGDGPFVIKAMELKMLHARLTPEQQAVYDRRYEIQDAIEQVESDEYTTESAEPGVNPDYENMDFHVKTIDMGKFNTINLQKALAESMKELMDQDGTDRNARITGRIMRPMLDDDYMSTGEMEQDGEYYNTEALEDDPGYYGDGCDPYGDPAYDGQYAEGEYADGQYDDGQYVEGEYAGDGYSDGQYDDGQYEGDGYAGEDYDDPGYGDGYAGEYAEGEYVEGEYAGDGLNGDGYAGGDYPGEQYAEEEPYTDGQYAEEQYTEEQYIEDGYAGETYDEAPQEERYSDADMTELTPAGETVPLADIRRSLPVRPVEPVKEEVHPVTPEPAGSVARTVPAAAVPGAGAHAVTVKPDEVFFEDNTADIVVDSLPSGTNPDYESMHSRAERVRRMEEEEKSERRAASVRTVVHPERPVKRGMEDMLYLGEDGQLGLAVPPQPPVEKQITGQIHIDDYFSGWEETKRRKKEEQEKEFSRSINQRTGPIFKDYDARKHNGIIEEIDRERQQISEMYRADDIELRSVEEVQEEEEAPLTPTSDSWHATGSINIMGDGGRDIWDDVEDAIAAEHAVAEANVTTMSTGTIGLVDPVVSAAADLTDSLKETGGESVDPLDVAVSAMEAPSETTEISTLSEEETAGEDVEEITAEESGDADELTGEEEADGGEEASGEDEYIPESGEEYPGEEEYAGEEEYGEDSDNAPVDAAALVNTAQVNAISNILEADADRVGVETVEEINDDYDPIGEGETGLSTDEQELFGDFLYSRKMKDQLLEAIDQISLAPYVGNAIITGDPDTGVLELGKAMIKELQMIDGNFVSSRVAKISGRKMNRKDIPAMLNQLAGGALLIENAGEMTRESLETVTKSLETLVDGIFIILMDVKKEIDRMLSDYELLSGYFNARIDIIPMNNNALVDYAKKYAYSQEYKIDEERGVLALHQRISELQIGEHNVTTREIEEIIDDAIEHSMKPRIGTFFSILGGKRYDYEDMIILREKDFV
ncbi:MAG: hypothetical protein IKI75_03970 [Lachnospiraceae bacterium]|nr:hypothetical protein [Lachnospiraceae bacterium]